MTLLINTLMLIYKYGQGIPAAYRIILLIKETRVILKAEFSVTAALTAELMGLHLQAVGQQNACESISDYWGGVK